MASLPNHERYVVDTGADPASPYAGLVAGVRGARDTHVVLNGGMLALAALPVQQAAPPHPWLDMLTRMTIPGLILPTARVVAHGADWILCPHPERPAVDRHGGLDEQTLMNKVLRPVAAALSRMREQQLTHRAIRPENLFAAGDGVELGPFWLTPPAFLQPAIYETPASASCIPQARGRGTVADDIYALGVTILALYLGKTPMEGVPDAEVIERKLWQGSYAALVEGHRVPIGLGEIIAAMVSDQASQRPTPDRLCRTSVITGPAAGSRKRVNAAIPMMLAGHEVWNTPQLAYLIGEIPDAVGTALDLGQIDSWLRRGLNEMVLAERLETVVHPGGLRASSGKTRNLDPNSRILLLSRVAHLLDPEAPLVWDRMRLSTDGLPGLLAARGQHPLVPEAGVVALLSSEALITSAMDEPSGPVRELALASARRAMAAARTPSALLKLTYDLNPTFACASPLLTRCPVVSLGTLIPALEQLAERPDGLPKILDLHLQSFIVVRRSAAGMKNLRSNDDLTELRLLASIWADLKHDGVPHLARQLARPLLADQATWPGASRRAARSAAIEAVIGEGDLVALLHLAEDDKALKADTAEQERAHQRIGTLRMLRDQVAAADRQRETMALRFGREGVAVVGAAACSIALLVAVLA